jgi:hypothetical protein
MLRGERPVDATLMERGRFMRRWQTECLAAADRERAAADALVAAIVEEDLARDEWQAFLDDDCEGDGEAAWSAYESALDVRHAALAAYRATRSER